MGAFVGKRVKVDDVANLAQYAKEEKVQVGIMKMLDKEAKGNGLKGWVELRYPFPHWKTYRSVFSRFETIKRVHISFEPFTAENGLMTPTFKVKRYVFLVPFERIKLMMEFLLGHL